MLQPQDRDELSKGVVKNDRLDAAALCQRLDRYERGNKKAFRMTTSFKGTDRPCSHQLEKISSPLFLNSCPHGRLYLRYNDQLAGLV